MRRVLLALKKAGVLIYPALFFSAKHAANFTQTSLKKISLPIKHIPVKTKAT